MKTNIDWYEVLDVFCWGVSMLAMPSIGGALRGFDEDRYRTLGLGLWRRLEREKWVARTGRGKNARFTITERGRERCAEPDPHVRWNRPWDRKWRLVTFDVPITRNKDRLALWREFRLRSLGCLQQSVWIWPHEVEGIVNEIIEARGIPECFAGFECSRLFLCKDEEIVRIAWDFEGIRRAHTDYLSKAGGQQKAIRAASDLTELARAARSERLAYQTALENDPLLPRVLWPEGYVGHKVRDAHERARVELTRRMVRLAADNRV
jgi:DNA-binding transcriptional regulator PaaX